MLKRQLYLAHYDLAPLISLQRVFQMPEQCQACNKIETDGDYLVKPLKL